MSVKCSSLRAEVCSVSRSHVCSAEQMIELCSVLILWMFTLLLFGNCFLWVADLKIRSHALLGRISHYDVYFWFSSLDLSRQDVSHPEIPEAGCSVWCLLGGGGDAFQLLGGGEGAQLQENPKLRSAPLRPG